MVLYIFPSTVKIAKPAYNPVKQSNIGTKNASRIILFLKLLKLDTSVFQFKIWNMNKFIFVSVKLLDIKPPEQADIEKNT